MPWSLVAKVLSAIGLALVRSAFTRARQWWIKHKQKEADNAALEAKEMEAESLAKPTGDWNDTVNKLP